MEQRVNYLIAGVFVALIFLTIIFVTAILPATTFQPKPTPGAVKYTAQEIRGRNIYRREGCFYCHSQFVRKQDRDMGEMVQAGDYVNETPHVLGTERTGPDLSNIGGKYPDGWHWAHHIQPRKMKPGSIMPPFSHLTEAEMTDLIAYLQTLGRNRKVPSWIVPPQEIRDDYHLIAEAVDVNSAAAANAGRGIFQQNCAMCHGVNGQGNGPVSTTMMKKPANFHRPFYKAYSDAMWYWRIAEGVPGTRMPRWNKALSDEDMLYLVAYLKTLPLPVGTSTQEYEVTEFSQVNDPADLSRNFYEIESLNKGGPYYYGGGRSK
ncbi:MAG: cbb3-type cytochrome c oxidase subunit II [Candidatus Melainabacteria bacterium]|nr:cbb3-type cytochrome c oxidase subunit II [Candidatus Melainabacteria bacterium]